MNTTVPLLMWNVVRSSGSIDLHRVQRELVERDQQPEDDEHERTPPLANACFRSRRVPS